MPTAKPEFIELPHFSDERGSFLKIFQSQHPALADFQVRQINLVDNPEAGILRGLHYQKGEHAEAKLFRVLKGCIQLVAFDTRPDSPTYAQARAWLLRQPQQALLIPKGYATGYLVCEPQSLVLYCSDNDYQPQAEAGIAWNDPLILRMVSWEHPQPKISDKDKAWLPFLWL